MPKKIIYGNFITAHESVYVKNGELPKESLKIRNGNEFKILIDGREITEKSRQAFIRDPNRKQWFAIKPHTAADKQARAEALQKGGILVSWLAPINLDEEIPESAVLPDDRYTYKKETIVIPEGAERYKQGILERKKESASLMEKRVHAVAGKNVQLQEYKFSCFERTAISPKYVSTTSTVEGGGVRQRDTVRPSKIETIAYFLPGEMLREFIDKNPLKLLAMISVIKQVLWVGRSLHEKGLIHGDFKLDNLLIGQTSDKQRYFLPINFSQTKTTAEYMAPELFVQNTRSLAADAFGCGVTAWYLLHLLSQQDNGFPLFDHGLHLQRLCSELCKIAQQCGGDKNKYEKNADYIRLRKEFDHYLKTIPQISYNEVLDTICSAYAEELNDPTDDPVQQFGTLLENIARNATRTINKLISSKPGDRNIVEAHNVFDQICEELEQLIPEQPAQSEQPEQPTQSKQSEQTQARLPEAADHNAASALPKAAASLSVDKNVVSAATSELSEFLQKKQLSFLEAVDLIIKMLQAVKSQQQTVAVERDGVLANIDFGWVVPSSDPAEFFKYMPPKVFARFYTVNSCGYDYYDLMENEFIVNNFISAFQVAVIICQDLLGLDKPFVDRANAMHDVNQYILAKLARGEGGEVEAQTKGGRANLLKIAKFPCLCDAIVAAIRNHFPELSAYDSSEDLRIKVSKMLDVFAVLIIGLGEELVSADDGVIGMLRNNIRANFLVIQKASAAKEAAVAKSQSASTLKQQPNPLSIEHGVSDSCEAAPSPMDVDVVAEETSAGADSGNASTKNLAEFLRENRQNFPDTLDLIVEILKAAQLHQQTITTKGGVSISFRGIGPASEQKEIFKYSSPEYFCGGSDSVDNPIKAFEVGVIISYVLGIDQPFTDRAEMICQFNKTLQTLDAQKQELKQKFGVNYYRKKEYQVIEHRYAECQKEAQRYTTAIPQLQPEDVINALRGRFPELFVCDSNPVFHGQILSMAECITQVINQLTTTQGVKLEYALSCSYSLQASLNNLLQLQQACQQELNKENQPLKAVPETTFGQPHLSTMFPAPLPNFEIKPSDVQQPFTTEVVQRVSLPPCK